MDDPIDVRAGLLYDPADPELVLLEMLVGILPKAIGQELGNVLVKKALQWLQEQGYNGPMIDLTTKGPMQ